MSKAQIAQWKSELTRDYPNVEKYFIDLVCELYERNPEYIKKLHKRKFKNIETETPKEIVGAVSVINNPESSFLQKYFQEPIVLKDDEQTAP